jgi:hypothetical protein
MNDLNCDPNRMDNRSTAGIYIRAKVGERWDSVEIAQLTRASLVEWLSEEPDRALQVVLLLLNHPPVASP